MKTNEELLIIKLKQWLVTIDGEKRIEVMAIKANVVVQMPFLLLLETLQNRVNVVKSLVDILTRFST